MLYLDSHTSVKEWASESTVIPYVSPIDGKYHRYFVDFRCVIETKDGKIQTVLIEVKPREQCNPPKLPQRITEAYVNRVKTYGVNQAKWAAAKEFCRKKGYQFIIMDEFSLGIKK